VGRIAPLKRMKFMPMIEKGQHTELPFVRYIKAESMTITCNEEVPAHMDGEYIFTSRFDISCLPQKFLFSV
jgi:diacylglycerol kinase (ATP)